MSHGTVASTAGQQLTLRLQQKAPAAVKPAAGALSWFWSALRRARRGSRSAAMHDQGQMKTRLPGGTASFGPPWNQLLLS